MRAILVVLVGVVGCVGEDPPRPDIENATIRVTWSSPTARYVAVSIPEIPCVGTEDDLLGESGVRCDSAPWSVTVDGVALDLKTISCEAAHDGWFGPVAKHCDGTTTSIALPDSADADVELVITTGSDELRHTLHGVRRTYTFAQEAAADTSANQPGIVRVDDVELHVGSYEAEFSLAARTRRGDARVVVDNTGRLALEPPFAADAGEYQVRVLAYTTDGAATIAVPIEGMLTIE